jgi:two-component system, NarL family, sensor histidine kinase DesK
LDDSVLRVDDSRRNVALQAGSAPLLQEASRVARELHDGLAQSLFALAATAKELRDREPPGTPARRDAETMLELAQAGSRQLREAFGAFRGAGAVARRGLGAAVAELRGEAREVDVDVDVDEDLRDATDLAAELLYRTCREGLANVARHAHARRCRVRCGLEGRVATATVADDGVGARAGGSDEGFGLRFLDELLQAAGGSLTIASSDTGTLLTARVPLVR